MPDLDAELQAVYSRLDELDELARAKEHQEFLDDLPARIREEQVWVDEHLAKGYNLVVNSGSGRTLVHSVNCASIQQQLNRTMAWSVRLGHDTHHISKPRLPNFVAEADLEQLRSYRQCGTCQPLLQKPTKRTPRAATRMESISRYHLGRDFETLEGRPLGRLVSFEVAQQGITLHFKEITTSYPWTGSVQMLPKPNTS